VILVLLNCLQILKSNAPGCGGQPAIWPEEILKHGNEPIPQVAGFTDESIGSCLLSP
jgi:hypothetical protein